MREIETGVLIIGSGIAGLYLAKQLSDAGEKVTIITKETMKDSSTFYAQGGVASVITDMDSIEDHLRDTLVAGAGLCNEQAVRVLVEEGPSHMKRLMELGVPFDRDDQGAPLLAREGGHGASRILHAGDHTGRAIAATLEEVVRESGVEIHEYHSAVELITNYHLDGTDPASVEPRCYGAYVYNRNTWEIDVIRAKATVLATGGAGQLYMHNTNPNVSTGDGIALGYRAGAVITNLEFYQFHPTALYSPNHASFLISEAVRGYGGILRGHDGQPFMLQYDERAELAPRDIVARAIDAEMKKTGAPHVWLDVTHKSREDLMGRFPTIFSHCLELGIDISREFIPVVPAAHYLCGGVETDLNGQTCVTGLFAAGETAHTGVHGGNRLASNSLLEGLVFSARIAGFIRSPGYQPVDVPAPIRKWNKEGLHNVEEWILVQHNFDALKRIMHNYVGIVRSDLRLERALRRITLLYDEVEDFYQRTFIQNKILELRNMICVARLIVQSAMQRKESRGLHFSQDYPEDRSPSSNNTRLQRRPGLEGKKFPERLAAESGLTSDP